VVELKTVDGAGKADVVDEGADVDSAPAEDSVDPGKDDVEAEFEDVGVRRYDSGRDAARLSTDATPSAEVGSTSTELPSAPRVADASVA
jgi:hypothetical protein